MKTDSDKFDVETGSTDSQLHPAKLHSSAINLLNNCRTNVPESEGSENLESNGVHKGETLNALGLEDLII